MAKRVSVGLVARELFGISESLGSEYLYNSLAEHGEVDKDECVDWMTVERYINAKYQFNSEARNRQLAVAWRLFERME